MLTYRHIFCDDIILSWWFIVMDVGILQCLRPNAVDDMAPTLHESNGCDHKFI